MADRKRKAVGPVERSPLKSASSALPASRSGRAPSERDIPATCGMLSDVRTELVERFDAADKRIDAVEKRIDAVENRLMGEIHRLEAAVHGVASEVHSLKSQVARVSYLVEEQNARNKIVLDALVAFIDRQDRVEKRMDSVEETVRALATARPAA